MFGKYECGIAARYSHVISEFRNSFVDYWWLVLVSIVAGIFGKIKYRMQTKTARQRWDRLKLKIPAIGSVVERSLLARFCRSFSVMLNAGVPLTQALNLVADAVDNPTYVGSYCRNEAWY